MDFVKYFARRLIDLSSRVIPMFIWKLIEKFALRAQGKGWGANSIHAEIQTIKTLADRLNLNEIICADVGANVGSWALFFNRTFPSAKIICFEPSTVAYKRLLEVTSGISEIECVNFAISTEPGEAIIYSDFPASGLASMSKRRLKHFKIEMKYEEHIRVTSLDAWIAENGISPNILKLDIEGFELAALHGAQTLLKSLKIIQFEFGGANIDTRTFFQDFWYLLTDLQFKIYRLGPRGITYIVSYSENDETFITTNYIAVRG